MTPPFFRYLVVCTALAATQPCFAADKTKLQLALFEAYGNTAVAIGRLTVSSTGTPDTGHFYEDLALKVAAKVDEGRAAGTLLRSQTDATAAILTYTAAVDPEPFSKTAAALAAFGFQKAGDALSEAVQQRFVADANRILATGLERSNYSPAQLQAMSPEQYRKAIQDFQIGDQKLREILPPESLGVVTAAAERLKTNQQVATLLGVKRLQGDVASVKQAVEKTARDFTEFAKASEVRMTRIETGLGSLQQAADQQKQALDQLQVSVAGNQAAIRSLAQVSSMSWTPEQKLAALDAGLISGLGTSAKDYRAALLSEIDTKRQLKQMQDIASDLGAISTIAQNLGLPPEITTAAQVGQTVAGALVNVGAGNYLGAAAALSSLAGLGRGDAGAARHAALMAYLGREFAKVNARLDNIEKLQKTTLETLIEVDKKIDALAVQLNRVENTVTLNRIALQQVLVQDWLPCDAVMGALNNRGAVSTLDDLQAILDKPLNGSALKECEVVYHNFFNGRVVDSRWGDGILGMVNFPHGRVFANIDDATASTAIALQEQKRYEKARNFLLQYALEGRAGSTQRLLARLLEPAGQVDEGAARDARIEAVRSALDNYRCNQATVMAEAIQKPLCQGVPANEAPQKSILAKLFDRGLAGPQALRLIDVGLPVAQLLQFVYTGANQVTLTVPWSDVAQAGTKGLSERMKAAKKRGGDRDMVERLDWLSAGYLLQQSVMYGDATAAAIVEVLWDPATNALRTAVQPNEVLQAYALEAMDQNGPLARNVVMLALRKALTRTQTSPGGRTVTAPAAFVYELGLRDLKGAEGCQGTGASLIYLRQALPNWSFTLRRPQDGPGQEKRPELAACAVDDGRSDVGHGVGVQLGAIFVKAPLPDDLRQGRFERPASLDLAWHYRTRIAEAKTLARVGELLPDPSRKDAAAFINELMASSCFDGVCKVRRAAE